MGKRTYWNKVEEGVREGGRVREKGEREGERMKGRGSKGERVRK